MVICKLLLINSATSATGSTTGEHEPTKKFNHVALLQTKDKQIRFVFSMRPIKLPNETKCVYATLANLLIQICKKS